ncbi:MAG: VanW family protein [Clostridia bacterium]|nr:VanW family protein [Clostridia bacterium]
MDREIRKGGRQERRREAQLDNGQVIYGTGVRPQEQREDTVPVYGASRPVLVPAVKEQEETARKRRWPWVLLALVSLALLLGLFVLLGPQLLGIRFYSLPNLAFTGLSVIEMDDARLASYREMRETVYTDTFYPGVSIDGLDLSGMTVSEAREALSQVPAGVGSTFSITVEIEGKQWTIGSDQVPMTRDTEAQLMKAYALGRTVDWEGTGTPLEKRMKAVQALREHPVALVTTLSFDRENIRKLTDSICASMEKAPENAYVAAFDLASRTFLFGDDVPGVHVDGQALFEAVMACLDGGDWYGTVRVKPQSVLADMTKTELMNGFRKISSYSTNTTSNNNRNTNIRLSCEAINGMMVAPGETFSFNQATGERTTAKGYKPATAISGGQNIEEVGGGVCQTSSTLFNAAARADLEIVYRSPHAWPSSYVEKGMDATVNWPGLDFKFRNQTDWPVYIVASYANRKVTVELYGMSLGDGTTIDLQSRVVRTLETPSGVNEVRNESLKPGTRKTTVKARKGYVVETDKVWFVNGQEVKRELLCTSTYKAYQETVEYN